MFKSLTLLAYQRTKKEAFGFYLAYLLLIIVLGALVAGVIALITGESSFEFGVRVGNLVAVLVALVIGFLLLRAKGMLSNFGSLLLVLVSGVLAYFVGGIGGLIIPAWLTTRLPRAQQQVPLT